MHPSDLCIDHSRLSIIELSSVAILFSKLLTFISLPKFQFKYMLEETFKNYKPDT